MNTLQTYVIDIVGNTLYTTKVLYGQIETKQLTMTRQARAKSDRIDRFPKRIEVLFDEDGALVEDLRILN